MTSRGGEICYFQNLGTRKLFIQSRNLNRICELKSLKVVFILHLFWCEVLLVLVSASWRVSDFTNRHLYF